MRCPQCGSLERQGVKETRTGPDGRIKRRRQCPACAYVFVTTEQVSVTALQVRKSGGGVVAFRRDAVRRSVARAMARELPRAELETFVDRVVEDVYRLGDEGPISTRAIGSAVLRHLREFDPASHIQFALVHEGRRDRGDDRIGWGDVEAFRRWMVGEYGDLEHLPAPRGLERVHKRRGGFEPFRREKLARSVEAAARGRGTPEQVARLAKHVMADVERAIGDQPCVTSGQIGSEVLRSLRVRDHIGYLRFASLTKGYRDPRDYAAETVALRHAPVRQPAFEESGSDDYY